MKRIVIATVVGAVIVFIYQALAWMVPLTHGNSIRNTEAQDEILTLLNQHLTEDGVYHVPWYSEDASEEEKKQIMEKMEGQPWAQIRYHRTHSSEMAAPIITGFILNLLAVLAIVLVITCRGNNFVTFTNRFLVTAAFYAVALFQVVLTDWNWWRTPGHYLSGQIIDLIIMAILLGLWLGWYLKPEIVTRTETAV